MTTLHTLGFPRIGAQRELKQAQEAFWRGESSVETLHTTARQLRQRHWLLQKGAGIERIAVGDFTLYDHVLDHQVLFGALPARFGLDVANLSTEDYFALARGNAQQPALEMTKWFDTNYHYLVPEFDRQTVFQLQPTTLFNQQHWLGWNA